MSLLIGLVLPGCVAFKDPAPGLYHDKDASRNLECARVSAQTAARIYPGQVAAPAPRGDFAERTVFACEERMLALGLRSPRDEAILSSLDVLTDELTATVAATRPDLHGTTWLVETYYPNPEVAAKVSFATKASLQRQGLEVSDRTPVLGLSDLEVITRMEPDDAYPAACTRYTDTGGLGSDDTLFAVVMRDRRETILHAGLCTDGQWTWVL